LFLCFVLFFFVLFVFCVFFLLWRCDHRESWSPHS
jgi:hypothetical protein